MIVLKFKLRNQISQSLDAIACHPKLAQLLCQLIPASCPFERDIKIFQHTVFHIPPLCKLNPFYEQVVSLRFRCLSYLANECDEDITIYT